MARRARMPGSDSGHAVHADFEGAAPASGVLPGPEHRAANDFRSCELYSPAPLLIAKRTAGKWVLDPGPGNTATNRSHGAHGFTFGWIAA